MKNILRQAGAVEVGRIRPILSPYGRQGSVRGLYGAKRHPVIVK
jgi:hypothetical protein